MTRNIKTLSLMGGARKPKCIGFMFGVVGLCFACTTFADSVIDESVANKKSIEFEMVSGIGEHAEMVDDSDLSAIMGMGAEAIKLESGDSFAVLLWDERGNGSKRISGHGVDGSQNYQAVNLTVNRR